MKNRQTILLVVTLIAGATFLIDRFGLLDVVVNLTTLNNAQVEAQENKNVELRDQVEEIDELVVDFQKIEAIFNNPEDADDERGTAYVFTEELNALLKQLGQKNPDIKPARIEPLPDVSDYHYIVVQAKVSQLEEQYLKRLLLQLEERRMIVQKIDIRSPQDTGIVNVDMDIARIERVQPLSSEASGLLTTP